MSKTGARKALIAGSAVAFVAAAGTAEAQSTAGTTAGTTISNTAQASYTVNGTSQTAQSNTATFVVDRKVNLTVIADQPGNILVNSGQTAAYARFKVTNNTNGIQDFHLAATQAISVAVLPGTDNYDLNNFKVFVDGNNNGTYDPGVDTMTYIDELAPDANIEVFIVGDVPAAQSTGLAFVGLDVIAATGGTSGTKGAVLIPTPLNTLNQDSEIDVVFADNDNDGVGFDIARNGQGWAYAAFEVRASNVALTVTKSANVISDDVSTLNPKALPGAIVEYCLKVTNGTTGVAADNVLLSDVVPANTTYVPGTIVIGAAASVLTDCTVSGYTQNDNGTQASGPYLGAYNATTKTITATIPTLSGNATVAASFRVKIN
ncbi:putative repeat protein (TIGR01451 family) [Sphingomonas jinjuensis]|uniref:Putative repeat protein (TIGR01451 family) n=1 Tax=Sphingomonas jinjuensis TaxID=535907 RepID=A0A840FGW7_9SPHN|nr:DUF11 domain-containing protein [Sphingomonas jinjuensis]MBB4152575.1 putative repeat protein (TIGR01451 family) [Sphingomonas jinjuensis]